MTDTLDMRWQGLDDLRPLLVPIDTLDTMPGNPRRGDVAAVARSYRTFGQRKPVVTRDVDGRHVVTAGNHQLLAARDHLRWTHLAIARTDDDDETAAAFSLADNRTGELGGYDDAELLAQLEQVADAELRAATAWSLGDIDRVIKRVSPELDTTPQLAGVEFRVLITCTDELQQAELLARFQAEGLTCKGQMI